MNIEQARQPIINEWQLGQQLNTAVHNGSREKFNLLLCFLSADARDFAQFDIASETGVEKVTCDLRTKFELRAPQLLVNEGPSAALLAELNNDLHKKKLVDIRLKQLLVNEALLSKQATGVFPDDILDNLPLLVKQRVNDAYRSNLAEPRQRLTTTGIDASLMADYQKLDFESKPVYLHSA